jgi:hypothetical protein
METLTALVHLLDATAEDRWRAGHPSTRPLASAADRAHDSTRPPDPTADAVTDPARLRLAEAWRAALRHAQWLAGLHPDVRPGMIRLCEDGETSRRLAALSGAYSWWLGPEGS